MIHESHNYGNSTGLVQTSLTDINDGAGNTASLQSGGANEDSDSVTGGVQPHLAAQYCADLSIHGYSDWYLPASSELYLMRIYRTAIGDFANDVYWSSTESDSSSQALEVEFDTTKPAEIGDTDKYDSSYVRCMRK